MDWTAAIETNRDALKRVLAGLFAMAHIDKGDERPGPLPRILHRTVLRLLRPAEAAARRLVIVAAGMLVVPAVASRDESREAISAGSTPQMASRKPPSPTPARPRLPCLSLFDPPTRWRPSRPRPPACVPRISFPGIAALSAVRRPPLPFDELDTSRLALRLSALGAVLDDLPKQALRFARWRARRDELTTRGGNRAARPRRIWPLRPGRPPGRHSPRARRPAHKVHEILNVVHGLAIWALEPPDTS